MIVETFFLMAEKRSIRTLFFQDLCRKRKSRPGCGDMAAARCGGGQLKQGSIFL
jgi:hypothetical protein